MFDNYDTHFDSVHNVEEFTTVLGIIPLSVFGIVFNILTVIVLHQIHSIRRTSRFLLQALSVTDAVFLTIVAVQHTAAHLAYIMVIKDFTRYCSPYLIAVTVQLWRILRNASMWLVVAVAADRYMYVYWPQPASQRNIARDRLGVFVVFAASIILTVPYMFAHHVIEFDDEWFLVQAEIALSNAFIIGYDLIVCFVINACLPFLLVIFFLIRLTRYIRQRGSTRGLEQLHHMDVDAVHNERQFTVMLIAMNVTFLVCRVVAETSGMSYLIVSYCIDRGHPKCNNDTHHSVTTLLISGLIVRLADTVGASTKFLAYVSTNNVFRHTLSKLFHKCYYRCYCPTIVLLTNNGTTEDSFSVPYAQMNDTNL